MSASVGQPIFDEKVFLADDHHNKKGTVSPAIVNENRILKDLCQEIGRTRILSEAQREALETTFPKKFQRALGLAEGEKVRKYRFSPSGRILWVVTGRGREYQVLPESMFCTCDDYYFRVMDHKKQLCYHIIAQRLSEAMGKYIMTEMIDSRYPEITSKLTAISPR
jgi:predicted nucleic acid-binding Zn finger protein